MLSLTFCPLPIRKQLNYLCTDSTDTLQLRKNEGQSLKSYPKHHNKLSGVNVGNVKNLTITMMDYKFYRFLSCTLYLKELDF